MKQKAKIIIQNELKKEKLTYIKLSQMMKEKGYNYSENTIRSKINRGSFSFVFLLEVCDVLGMEICFEKGRTTHFP